MKQNHRRGFTLVELLVVIGIIALLISILIPTLNKARRAANTTKGLANLHSIGLALQMYCGANKGILPPGEIEYTPDGTGDYAWWYHTLNPYMTANKNATHDTLPNSALTKVYKDPSAIDGGYIDYSVHGVAMPDYYAMLAAGLDPAYWPAPAKLSTLKPTFCLITDGAQYANSANVFVAYPVLENIDDGYIVYPGYTDPIYQSQWFLDPTDPYASQGFPNWGPVLPGPNDDSGSDSSFSNVRWRQVDASAGSTRGKTNALFADGHAETIAQGDFKRAFFLLQPRY